MGQGSHLRPLKFLSTFSPGYHAFRHIIQAAAQPYLCFHLMLQNSMWTIPAKAFTFNKCTKFLFLPTSFLTLKQFFQIGPIGSQTQLSQL